MIIQVEMPHRFWDLLIHVERGQKGGALGRKLAGCCARWAYIGI